MPGIASVLNRASIPAHTQPASGVATVTLPRYLLTGTPTVLEGFEDHTQWTVTSEPNITTLAADTTNFTQGTKGLKATGSDFGFNTFEKDFGSGQNWSAHKACIRFNIYRDPACQRDQVRITLLDGSGNYTLYDATSLHYGWNTINILEADWTPAFAHWDAVQFIQLKFTSMAAGDSFTFDNLIGGVVAQPAALIAFDDGMPTAYSLAFPALAAHKANGTFYLVTSWVGDGNHITWANATTMAAAGCTIGNHTDNHADINGTQAAAETRLAAGYAALVAQGISANSAKQVAYPHGAYKVPDTLAAMTAQGMLTGRSTETARLNVLPLPNLYQLQAQALDNTLSLAQAKALADLAVSRKEIIFFFGHSLGAAADGTTWVTADFTALLTYIVAQGVPMLTAENLYALTQGSVTITQAV